MHSGRRKGLLAYLIRLLAERFCGLLLFLIGSGWVIGPRAVLWFIVYFATIVSLLWLYHVAPHTMEARLAIAKTKDSTPVWDKVLLALFWLLAYFAVYWAAGRSCNPLLPIDALAAGGVATYVLSSMLTGWALAENRYAEAVSRVQKERDQRVCASGPYAFIRHPMYAAILMWCAAIVLIFPSVWVAAIAVAVVAVIVIRTTLEDTMLTRGLEGYKQYCSQVRWRLIPFVW